MRREIFAKVKVYTRARSQIPRGNLISTRQNGITMLGDSRFHARAYDSHAWDWNARA